jgi:hypothetical protein
MQKPTLGLLVAMVVALLLCLPKLAQGHGILGDRFFPPTISTDDPFAVDELALPTISLSRNPGNPASWETDAGFEFDKEILPGFAIGVSDTFVWQKPDQGSSVHGWSNVTVTGKYQLWTSAQHEAIVSAGLYSHIGGTGNTHVAASSFSTFAPAIFLGKGFGDLPDSMGALRPLAITSVLDQTFPTSSSDPNAFEYGFAIEYSLPYLMQNVKDIGLPRPLRDMIPLVEFAFSTPENRDQRGLTTGTINPGVLWENPYFQLGIEANIPINGRSGTHVGVIVQMWIYIDDIFPRTFGHPLFGE